MGAQAQIATASRDHAERRREGELKAVDAKHAAQMKAMREQYKPQMQAMRAARQRGDTAAVRALWEKSKGSASR